MENLYEAADAGLAAVLPEFLYNIWVPVAIVGGLGLLFGILLAIAGKIFSTESNPIFDMVRAELPGANCGACGHGTCDKYAEAVAFGEAPCNLCNVGGAAVAAKLAEITGTQPAETKETGRAIVCCYGGVNATAKYDYQGLKDCTAAAALGGGPMACQYGCIGLGSCVRACPQGAIRISNGVAKVTPEECICCGICVNTCPKGIIKLIPRNANVLVTCSNHFKGAAVRADCTIGCLGCHLCEKECPTGAITVTDNLAGINYDLCIACGKCAAKCPRHLIVVTDSAPVVGE